jgi:hypothetical protein
MLNIAKWFNTETKSVPIKRRPQVIKMKKQIQMLSERDIKFLDLYLSNLNGKQKDSFRRAYRQAYGKEWEHVNSTFYSFIAGRAMALLNFKINGRTPSKD